MPHVNSSVDILATLAGLSQIFVGIVIVWSTLTTYRKDRPSQRVSDVESAVSGVVYGSGRIMLGLGVLSITVSVWRLLLGLSVGGLVLMFAGPFIARRVVRRFWHPSSPSVGRTESSP